MVADCIVNTLVHSCVHGSEFSSTKLSFTGSLAYMVFMTT